MKAILTNPELPVDEGFLSPTITWKKWRLPHPPAGGFGAWAEQAGLYSKGSDFTAAHIRAGIAGRSMLRRLWLGTNDPQPYVETTVWTLHDHKDMPCGVLVWEKTKKDQDKDWALISSRLKDCLCIGRISMWLSPQHRQKGWMGVLLGDMKHEWEDVARLALSKGKMPYLRGGDAAPMIIKKHSSIPLTHTLSSGKEEDQVLKILIGLSSNPWSPLSQTHLLNKKLNLGR